MEKEPIKSHEDLEVYKMAFDTPRVSLKSQTCKYSKSLELV
ncbi:hypothetical protein [Nostoc sp. CHAB 5715]|nr:hypothetical protein [Nostoc sp. CHAB 5715]